MNKNRLLRRTIILLFKSSTITRVHKLQSHKTKTEQKKEC